MTIKLTALLIDGIPINQVNHDYRDMVQIASQRGFNAVFKVEETVSQGYQDISSVYNFDKYKAFFGSDYRFFRARIIEQIALAGGFNSLSSEEKEIAAREFCVPKTDRDAIFTVDEQVKNGKEFHRKSTESRKNRRIAAEALVYNRMIDPLEQLDLISDVSLLLDRYVNFGIEGTSTGDPEGIFDYISSKSGTSYESSGFMQKNYTIEGMTQEEMRDRFLDILGTGEL